MKLRIYKYSIDIATARLLRLSSVLLLFCYWNPDNCSTTTTDSRNKKETKKKKREL